MEEKIPPAAGNGAMLIKPASWEAMRRRVEDLEFIPDVKDFDVATRGGKKFLRLRRVPGAVRPGPPPIPAFTLSAGATGARIYKGVLEWSVSTLRFETKQIVDAGGFLLEEVNSLSGQDMITGVEVMPRGNGSSAEDAGSSGSDDDGWWTLNWWGDVWAKVVLDAASGEPLSWDIVGPEKPKMRPIAALNSELSRGSSDGGSEEGEETGYAILIGTVPEQGSIKQERTGNLEWFCAFVPEGDGSSESGSSGSSSSASSGSSAGSSEASSASGASDISNESAAGSSKDTAIVPTPDGYRKWYAMEASEVMFFDFSKITVRRGINTVQIDPVVSFCMEKGSIRAYVSPERGSATVRVQGDIITLRASHWPWPATQSVQLMLCGIRRGFAGVRNGFATFTEFVDNECRLNPRMSRCEIIRQLGKIGIES